MTATKSNGVANAPAPCSRGRLALVLCLWATVTAALPASDNPLLGWETLTRLDRLAEFKPPIDWGCVSSYDRTGGNDDGFSGRFSFVRQEGDALVLADLEGPGAIYRIWTPTPTEDYLEFFFDGEPEPRIRLRFRDLFLGQQAPFVKPLVGYGVGGFFCYVPIPYQKSCKVLIRAPRIQFYQINYARYPETTALTSYEPKPTPDTTAASRLAQDLFARSGQDLSRWTTPPNQPSQTLQRRIRLKPGEASRLATLTQPGRIVGLRLRPARALADRQRGLVLRIAFDDQAPSVLAPVGDFFGFAWGEPAMRSLLLGTHQDTAYCYFPMPFDRNATLEILSESSQGPPLDLEAEIIVCPTPRRPHEGRFGAVWQRENPTRIGHPFTFASLAGPGHLVGFVLQAQGFESGKTLFFEGDDVTTADGRQAVHGTGSEDFFNGGWYDVPDRWEKPLNFPLSGCLGYQKHLGRTGGFRFLLGDAYSFQQEITQTIEHSGHHNDILTDHTGLTLYYAAHPAAARLPDVASRAVTDLTELVFPAGWQIPIRAFPFDGATLSRAITRIDEAEVRFLSLRGGPPDWVGPAYLYLTCHVPTEARYSVSIEALLGPEQGQVQLFQDEVPVGPAVDLYSAAQVRSPQIPLGQLQLEAGDNPIMLKLVGQNPQAQALGLDLIQVRLVRVP